jgi:hypothetical protein
VKECIGPEPNAQGVQHQLRFSIRQLGKPVDECLLIVVVSEYEVHFGMGKLPEKFGHPTFRCLGRSPPAAVHGMRNVKRIAV